MERWSGVLKIPLYPGSTYRCRIAASLCVSPHSKELIVPSANAICFLGDRVEGTGNSVIERLSNLQRVADILVSKFGASVNAWVIEASDFYGPFAVYKGFLPSVNSWGEPQSYDPTGFPASTSLSTVLLNYLDEVKTAAVKERCRSHLAIAPTSYTPDTYVLGFSKGGTVVNQLLAELGSSEANPMEDPSSHSLSINQIVPCSKAALLNSIVQIHYLDVGLNSAGAYITDASTIENVRKRVTQREKGLRVSLHGTPRQWSDKWRPWIHMEKVILARLLECEVVRSGEKLQVCERLYFSDRNPDLQMHFEIIDKFDIG